MGSSSTLLSLILGATDVFIFSIVLLGVTLLDISDTCFLAPNRLGGDFIFIDV